MYDADIRKAVEMHLAGVCDGDCTDTCECHAVTCKRILRLIKTMWEHNVAYPANEAIENTIDAMVDEGLVAVFTGCPIECFDEDRAMADDDETGGFCVPPCKSYRWCGNAPYYITAPRCTHVAGEDSRCEGSRCMFPQDHGGAHLYGAHHVDNISRNPAYTGEPPEHDRDWRPAGERLKQDKRGYSPRQTVGEYELFYADKESLPRYDHETRTYVREDLPVMFDCGCTRNKVLLGKCDVYGRDGRERGWRGDRFEELHGTA